jgi:hypothetical protein
MAQLATPTSAVVAAATVTGMDPGDRGIWTPTLQGDRGTTRWGRVMGRAGRRESGVFRDRSDVTDGRGNKTVVSEAARPEHSREGGSMHSGSDGSTRMIIRKDVEYSVSVET